MRAALILFLIVPAYVVSHEIPVTTTAPGDWSSDDVTPEYTQLLSDALSTGSYVAGDTHVCYTTVSAIDLQVVAGYNYRFYINGCEVTGSESDGACSSDTLTMCTPAEFVVQVFQQNWTNTLDVTSITKVRSGSSDTNPLSVPEPTPETHAPGDWISATVTGEDTQLLSDALSIGNYSESVGELRVCYTEVSALETQPVAGTNYRFHLVGCDVTGSKSEGACSENALMGCTLAEFVVQVFQQKWTDTLEVTVIASG
ncbi:hypothetical protein PHYBOEH_011620 [Phytophthora boehmeriae]|uniref:Uncharacterized protein n=1 Tax=Phytophthora boehmeriae TaxID=109152 RepID=A0A8T1X775_9STRA|nr:hypothetical protein PHYBOEH_011620 [Phytophthora boehmeriae]